MARCKPSMQESRAPCLVHNIAVVVTRRELKWGLGHKKGVKATDSSPCPPSVAPHFLYTSTLLTVLRLSSPRYRQRWVPSGPRDKRHAGVKGGHHGEGLWEGTVGTGALLPFDSIGHVEQIVQPVEAEIAVRGACDPPPVM